MWFIAILGLSIVSVAVLYLLHRIIRIRTTPAYVSVLAFISFLIPASIVVLLPIDLASGKADLTAGRNLETPISYLSSFVLLKTWRASYWLSFALTLTVLPIMQSFVESGHKDPWHRFKQSIRDNVRFQLIYLSIGLVGVLYILLNTNLRSFADFKALCIALTNTWGLFLALTLMGHGLVNVPKRVWRSANYEVQESEICARATAVWNKRELAANDEGNLAADVAALEKSAQIDIEWVEELISLFPSAVSSARANSATRSSANNGWFAISSRGSRVSRSMSDDELANMASNVRKAVNRKERYTAEWNTLVERQAYVIDIKRSAAKRRLIHRTFRSILSPTISFYHYYYLSPLVRRVGAVGCGLLSLSIIVAEVFINQERPSLRYVTYPITHWSIEIWSACLLTFMAVCCFSSLLRLKIFDRHALLDHGHTTQSSLFFYASYCCRVTIPLSYNFITLIPLEEYREMSTFSSFLGKAIDLQPLGRGFNDWLPLYILVPVVLTLLNTTSLLGSWMKDADEAEDLVAEGRAHLMRHISERYGEIEDLDWTRVTSSAQHDLV